MTALPKWPAPRRCPQPQQRIRTRFSVDLSAAEGLLAGVFRMPNPYQWLYHDRAEKGIGHHRYPAEAVVLPIVIDNPMQIVLSLSVKDALRGPFMVGVEEAWPRRRLHTP